MLHVYINYGFQKPKYEKLSPFRCKLLTISANALLHVGQKLFVATLLVPPTS